ncbi:MAG: SPASM domain-containing protein [Deltaproteobacteria bacterium]|nr:MAG: SPASM domain-containing protein [Deltaproteobacteria bacterium]
MKPSKFNIISSSKESPNKILLYNTLHDHRILFDDPELNPQILFEKLKNNFSMSEKESDVVSQLKEMGLVLDDEVDEQALFDSWYHEKIRERTDVMQVTILPTMNCNLACDYCFENDVRENGIMKPEMISQTIDWMTQRLTNIRPRELHMTFFGGEPLLHPKAIREISKSMWSVCESLNIEMAFGMVTNGVLLTPEFVEELLPVGFRWIKITFDGDREAHDKKRIKHNREGTFDIIYDNLCKIAGKLKVSIGGNFDNDNYASMFSLVDRIRQSPFANDIVSARFKPIMKINPDIVSGRDGKVTSFCEVCSFNDPQINGILALQEKTRSTGLPVQKRPEIGPCEYHSRHSLTIGPDGSLYKCPAFVGVSHLAAGHVRDEKYNAQGETQVTMPKWDEDCESCAYLPNCCGGCRMNSVNKTGSLEVKSCEGNYLSRSIEDFMQQEIARLSEE